ncbi:hypothetical protein OAC51_01210 [Flavobacteriaceae bacterium]|nr:hypothetical protein [Flavobacteriaceae bacterium]
MFERIRAHFNEKRSKNRIKKAIQKIEEFNASKVDINELILSGLKLTGNDLIKIIPHIVGSWSKVLFLDLSRNKIDFLPSEIKELDKLTELNLNYNELTELPSEIGSLTELVNLNLSSNKLTLLPSEIGSLTELVTLNLSSNKLTLLPSEIGSLTELVTLNLSSNKLTLLPPEIAALTGLTGLDLSSNELTWLPETMSSLFEVSINLNNNPLTVETTNWLTGYPFQHTSTDRAAYGNFMTNTEAVLKTLFPEGTTADKIKRGLKKLPEQKIYKLGDGSGKVEMISAKQVIDVFLSHLEFLKRDASLVKATKDLLNKIFDGGKFNEYKGTRIAILATSLGNCATPIKSHLISLSLQPHYENLKNRNELGGNIELLIEREALEDHVRKEIDNKGLFKDLNQSEHIERIHGLINTIYLDGAESNMLNEVKIVGERERLPSKSVYPEYAFTKLYNLNNKLHEFTLAFLKLVCEEDSNEQLLNDKNRDFILDKNKISLIKDNYLSNLGIRSFKEEILIHYRSEITSLLESFREANDEHLDFGEESHQIILLDPKRQILKLDKLFAAVNSSNLKEDEIRQQASGFIDQLKEEISKIIPYETSVKSQAAASTPLLQNLLNSQNSRTQAANQSDNRQSNRDTSSHDIKISRH